MAATFQPPQFSCDIDQGPSGAVIRPCGELDLASTSELEPLLEDVLATRPRHLVLDLSGLTFIDSMGLLCVLDLAERSLADGIALQLVAGGDAVMRVFDLTGTREVLPFRSAA